MTGDPEQLWAVRPRWRIQRGEEIALGPGKVDLLEAIARAGSISAAARELGMSYRRAWLLVEAMNRCFARPLVTTSSHRQQGARLTADGRAVLELYRHAERESKRVAHEALTAIVARLNR
jgi:molybdate transport system regulatory protein